MCVGGGCAGLGGGGGGEERKYGKLFMDVIFV